MIKLTDFNSICRLCLTKHDQQFVELFSKQKAAENITENDLFVAEMVASFCGVQITKGDGLPQFICSHCWNIVISMNQLQTVSVQSDRLLNDILNTPSATAGNESGKVKDYKIEFVDTQSSLEKESLVETVDKLTPLETTSKAKRSKVKVNNRKGRKKKFSEKKISCETCGKLVASNFIEFHLNVHKDIRPYKCEVEDCEKYFISPAHAKNHYTKVHVYGVIRPHKCDVCGRGFNQKSSLVTHRTYHFDPQIPCSICGQLYRNTRAMKKHLLVHSGERKYPCTECKKSFQTNFTLRIHMRTHTLEKPYSCTECAKSFAYKCLLKAHLKKHHPKGSVLT